MFDYLFILVLVLLFYSFNKKQFSNSYKNSSEYLQVHNSQKHYITKAIWKTSCSKLLFFYTVFVIIWLLQCCCLWRSCCCSFCRCPKLVVWRTCRGCCYCCCCCCCETISVALDNTQTNTSTHEHTHTVAGTWCVFIRYICLLLDVAKYLMSLYATPHRAAHLILRCSAYLRLLRHRHVKSTLIVTQSLSQSVSLSLGRSAPLSVSVCL